MFDLRDIPFQTTSTIDQTDTMIHVQAADFGDGMTAILGIDAETRAPILAIGPEDGAGQWHTSEDPADHPVLDRWFGHDEWREFLATYQEDVEG